MTPYGIQVTSAITFRGVPEETSRVYHYDGVLSVSGAEALANAVVAQDKLIHPSNHTYKKVRVYGPTDQTQAQNITQYIADLTGTGQFATTGGLMYPELAYYVSMYLGRNPATGRKRFLRKWIHAGKKLFGTGAVVDADPIDQATRDALENWFESCKTISAGGTGWDICAPNGDHLPLNTQAVAGDRLHIRQLKQ